MAGALCVHYATFKPGAITNTSRALWKVPTGGAFTLLNANGVQHAAGTVAVNIVTMGTAGTTVDGTIATLGSAVYVSGTPKAFTVSTSTPYVSEGYWLGVEEKNVGTLDATYSLSLSYVIGK